jgi:hypothetical protein
MVLSRTVVATSYVDHRPRRAMVAVAFRSRVSRLSSWTPPREAAMPQE